MVNQQTTLKQWLVNTPIFFALTAFLFTVIISIVGGLLLPKTENSLSIISVSMFVTTIFSAFLAVRRIPTHKMDRSGVVTIFNMKMLLLAITSFLSLLITLNMAPIQMWFIGITQKQSGLIIGFFIAVCLVLISLYVFGVIIMSLWACFLRARTLNIPLWKIICSIPFGFTMLWLPGYFLPNKTDKNNIVKTDSKWIKNLTNWTFLRPTNAGFLFAILVIFTSTFSGITRTMLTISALLIFAIWAMQVGTKKFEKSISGAYSTTAVIVNIAILTYMGIILHLI